MTMNSEQIAARLMETYRDMSSENIEQIRSVYAQDIRFEDPAHQIDGIDSLVEYFQGMYRNVESCTFEFHDRITSESRLMMTWTMTIRHAKLSSGETVIVDGCTYLRIEDGLVSYHRDYFDLGAMLYENLPVLGKIVRAVKGKLGQ